MSLAPLGFVVDTTPVKKAVGDLDQLTSATTKAAASTKGFDVSAQTAAINIKAVAAATELQTKSQTAAAAAAKLNTMALQAQAAAARQTMHSSRQLMFQLVDIGQTIPLAFQSPLYALQNLGFQIAQIGQMYAGNGGLTAAAKDSAGQIGRFVTGIVTRFPLATAAITAASVALVGMQREINSTGSATVSLADVALANFQVIREGVIAAAGAFYEYLRPAVEAVAPIFASAWDRVISGFKTVNNALIAGWGTVFDAISTGVMAVPDAFIAAGEAAANGFLRAIEQMGREALVAINDLLTDINGMLPQDMKLPLAPEPMSFKVGKVDIGGAAASKRLAGAMEGFKDRTDGRFATDYLGEYYDAVRKAANENARLGAAADDAGKAAADAAKKATDAWEGLRDVSKDARENFRESQEAMKDAAAEAGGLFRGLIDGTMDWKEALLEAIPVALQLLNTLNKSAGGSGIFGGGIFQSFIGGLLGIRLAKGGIMDRGNIVPFARGGVVTRPTVFPMADGAGLMGEDGPEAIMPLKRGADGKLGVVASRGADNQNRGGNEGGGKVINLTQNFHLAGAISARDVRAMAESGAVQAVDMVRRNLSDWQVQIARDGAMA